MIEECNEEDATIGGTVESETAVAIAASSGLDDVLAVRWNADVPGVGRLLIVACEVVGPRDRSVVWLKTLLDVAVGLT